MRVEVTGFLPGGAARWVFLLLLPAALGGCTELAVGTFDAKMSQMTDAECSYAHVLVGEAYCRSRTVAVESKPLYCFRNMGRVDCYNNPDPYDINRSGRVLEPPLVTVPASSVSTSAEAGPAAPGSAATKAAAPGPVAGDSGVPTAKPPPRPAQAGPEAAPLPTSLLPPSVRPAS